MLQMMLTDVHAVYASMEIQDIPQCQTFTRNSSAACMVSLTSSNSWFLNKAEQVSLEQTMHSREEQIYVNIQMQMLLKTGRQRQTYTITD